MSTAVTGATGQLGSLVIDSLLDRGVPSTEIVAVARDASKATALHDKGVEVRTADYADPTALRAALTGVDKLLLVSGSEVGRRVEQHVNVIEAAEQSGVQLIAYTSLLNADRSNISLAPEHQATEARLAESSVPSALLRNGWYWENYAAAIPQAVESGKLYGAAGEGRLAAATRCDFAAAAAAVLTLDDQGGKIYELGGERLTYTGFAEAISEISGTEVTYQDLPQADYAAALEQAGLPGPVAAMLADADAGIARGELDTASGDLQALIGRKPTPVSEVIKSVLN
jgi:NAD(P)H dehydrogenase (quinone)